MTALTLHEALRLAREHLRAGRAELSEVVARAVLKSAPDSLEAWNALTAALEARGQTAEAETAYRQALAHEPRAAVLAYNFGRLLRREGRLAEAETAYRQAVAAQPGLVEALSNLAEVLHVEGRHEEAIGYARQALALRGGFPPALLTLGNASAAMGRLEDAETAYRSALDHRKDLFEASLGLVRVYRRQNRLEEAESHCRQLVSEPQQMPSVLFELGLILRQSGRLSEAEAVYREAIAHQPDLPVLFNNLATVLMDQNRWIEAEAACRDAIRVGEEFAPAWLNLGQILQVQCRLLEAEESLRRALAYQPDLAEGAYHLGYVLFHQSRYADAAAACRRALAIQPDYPDASCRLVFALVMLGQYDSAEQAIRQAASYGRNPALCAAMGFVLQSQGRIAEALGEFQNASQQQPASAIYDSNALCCRQYLPGVTAAELHREHVEWGRRHAPPAERWARWHPNSRQPDRPLRLGFVSPDFGTHPVGYFLAPVLENLSREAFTTTCYNDRLQRDAMTERLQSAAGNWREVRSLSEEQLVEQIREDHIDILFDLAGHTAGNRLPVFACKPAPIQITWAGYVGTTGLSTIDYLLADERQVPPGEEGCYVEEVLRMPDGYLCYAPPEGAPRVAPLPALERGYVTFGSFSNPAKLNPEVVACWSRILTRLPKARLKLKYLGLDSRPIAERLRGLFAAGGVAAERLDQSGWSSGGELLAEYGQVDIGLDPFPFGGGLTTCEALWMGVPVITTPGRTFAGRHACTHLRSAGLAEMIAGDLDDYVRRAVGLAEDVPRLAALREGLRGQVAASPLCDGQRFASSLSLLLRQVWQRWCDRKDGSEI